MKIRRKGLETLLLPNPLLTRPARLAILSTAASGKLSSCQTTLPTAY